MGKDSMNDTAHRIDEELSKLSITEHRAITRMLTALFRFRAARDKAHSEMLGRDKRRHALGPRRVNPAEYEANGSKYVNGRRAEG